MDGEVEIAARELVDFINHKNASALEKRGLPSSEAPGVRGGKLHQVLPLSAQFSGGDGELEIAKGGSMKELDDGVGLSAAREASDVNEANGAWLSDVELAVEGDDLLSGVAGADGVDTRENAVKPVFHVGDKVLGALGPRAIGMNGADGEEITRDVEAERCNSKILGEPAGEGSRFIAKTEGEVAGKTVRARVVVDEENGGGVGHAELDDVLL